MRRTLAVVLCSTCALVAVPASAHALTSFQSPSKNIGCILDRGAARCDIRDKAWTAPKPAGCELDWGQGLSVARTGSRGRVVCAGDTVLNSRARVLKYGKSVRSRGTTCTSRSSGMTCRNGRGHGFRISKQSYRLF